MTMTEASPSRFAYLPAIRVGFDAHMVGQRETGNETYALGLLEGFNQLGFQVDAYTTGTLPMSIHREHRVLPPQSAVRVPLVTPLLAIRDRLDIFHATYVLPPTLPCPSVVTVHDITFALYPEWFSTRVRQMLSALVPLALRRASKVITISEHTKRDIVDRYDVAPEKIAVTPLAPRPVFVMRSPECEPTEPFFLFVGNVEPRKNVETVIEALRLLRDRGTRVRLVVAGKPGLHYASISRVAGRLGLQDWVEFTGYVHDEELRRLYGTCTALLHPALYEGFGLTPLEAMAQGAPVVAANTSSVPEVVGDAAILLEPYDVEAWTNVMERLLDDVELRSSLRKIGPERASRFSWRRCALETIEVYSSVLDAKA